MSRTWAPWRRTTRLPVPADRGDVVARVEGARLRLGGTDVLRGVDLTVRAGEVRALIGPNGAGKSSLLGVLTGDLTPHEGTVTVDGAPVGSWSATELATRRAVLLQQVGIAFPFPAEDVVRMGRAPWAGTPFEEDDDAAVAAAFAATDTGHLAARSYPTLSGGERARVALARVLAQRAGTVLLDEPTAALDLGHQELVLRVARERAEAGAAVVVVLHDLGLAAAHADQVTVLDDGLVVADGPVLDVMRADLLTQVYRHPVEVLDHPGGGAPIVLPRR
ncbi:iron complex transport system ATP-binding protein [Sediminihabitans luteus]|uniref:Iron complex transport system ATP-binding protein n=1 Tax=Sediminihabitans luteus TaxID=1138585 RepID=A0A2M9D160_9CELL|nr:heme ABC transporter ATP-binding protein [Sediminihabitans luteus]PJJ77718.1 iron complex transport system ATP-binding protein [Sediminihabitans luteus]GIJ00055.1 hemin import ATP-binding protein HmuV [Sediminihabitans luteus]